MFTIGTTLAKKLPYCMEKKVIMRLKILNEREGQKFNKIKQLFPKGICKHGRKRKSKLKR